MVKVKKNINEVLGIIIIGVLEYALIFIYRDWKFVFMLPLLGMFLMMFWLWCCDGI